MADDPERPDNPNRLRELMRKLHPEAGKVLPRPDMVHRTPPESEPADPLASTRAELDEAVGAALRRLITALTARLVVERDIAIAIVYEEAAGLGVKIADE